MITAEFSISVEAHVAAAVVRIRGDVDVTTISAVRDCLHTVCHQPISRIVVDLSGVSTADATLVATLVSARRTAVSRHCEFALQNPSTAVMRLISETGSTTTLPPIAPPN